MKKFSILKNLEIKKHIYGGKGIAVLENGKKVILEGIVIPQAKVDIKILKVKKDYIQGKIIKINEIPESVKLNKDLCPNHSFYFFQGKGNNTGCGGCKWHIFNYNDQLQTKQQITEESFQILQKIQKNIKINEIVPSKVVDGYRNKMEFSFGENQTSGKEWNLGLHKAGDFANIVDIQSCNLISGKANEILLYLKSLFENSGLPVYKQKTHEGFFRNLIIREGINTQQILINLVISESFLEEKIDYQKQRDILLEKIMSDSYLKENITTFIITDNRGLSDALKEEHINSRTIWGEGYIFEKLKIGNNSSDYIESKFRISPFSFFQTNTLGAEQLFSIASEKIGTTKGYLLDIYCGTGSIGLTLLNSGTASQLIGIEIMEEAIEDARFNAKINNLENSCYFACGKAERLISEDSFIQEKLQEIEKVVIDPPREGMHKNLVKFLIDMKKTVNFDLLYISCNPVTMARDIKTLIEGGFYLKQIQPVDMFPHTYHIENIGILK